MTAPTKAPVTGDGLRHVPPDGTLTARFSVAVRDLDARGRAMDASRIAGRGLEVRAGRADHPVMALRAIAALVAVLLFTLVGTATVASAQQPFPDQAGELDDRPWWENQEEDLPLEDEPPVPDEAFPVLPVENVPVVDAPPEPLLPEIPVPTTKTVPGKVAYVRGDGKAAIPRGAPKRVRQLLVAANQIVGKPYKWGGGHAKLVDRGYDCSGAVSYALIRTGLLRSPLVSGALARWGTKGAGTWVSVYANRGHVYLEVAGLRLDTSAVGDRGGRKGVRWRPVIGRRQGFAARHPAGL